MNSKPLPKIQSFLKELKRKNSAESNGKKQTFQEFHAAGGGVPTQYKGREHVWHAKVDKFAAGGAVQPAALIDGNDFVKAAQANGLKTDNATLNKIVARVNRGESVQEAAKNVAQSRAAGGEVKMAGGGDPRGEMRATPRNKALGATADAAKWLHRAASEPFGYANPPGEMLSELIGVPAVGRTLEKLAYGEPITNYGKANVPLMQDDTADAAMTIAPMVGPTARMAAKGAKAVGRGALDLAKSDAAYNLAQKALVSPALAAVRPMNVVKPKDGNFLTGRTEKDLQPLKSRAPTHRDEALLMGGRYAQEADTPEGIRAMAQTAALNKWVDSNLTNYVKKQMGTPDDPVRKLAEEGITHKPGLVDDENIFAWNPDLQKQRMEAGFPEEGMGQSPTAQAWERASDSAIATHRAGDIQGMPERFAKFTEAEEKLRAAKKAVESKFKQQMENFGIEGTNNMHFATSLAEKAKIVGDTDLAKASAEYQSLQSPMMDNYMELGRQNPYINKLAPETPMYAPFTGDLGFDHIMDVLREDVTAGRIRPEQLSKVSMEQAVRRTFEYDQELAAKANASRAAAREGLPTYKEYPEGYKWIELNKPGSFSQESEAMGHSVRGYEPPKGHPDWTEASGNAGSSGYGHGGWEAIKSGKTKVYSLVDSKGAPHATVEVGPTHRDRGFFGDQRPTGDDYYSQQNKYVAGQNDGTVSPKLTFAEWWRSTQGIPEPEALPPRISQIKGKGNRAPNEEYLPYIQDFVRGGQWSGVGDIQNTGMRPKSSVFNDAELQMLRERGEADIPHILSGEEIQRLHNIIVPEGKRLKYDAKGNIVGSEEGLAHGGEVHMAGGGAIKAALAKLGKFATESDLKAIKEAGRAAHEQDAWIRAAKNAEIEEKLKSMPARSKAANIEMGMYHPVGGGTKLSKPFEAMHSTRVKNPKVGTPEVRIITPEDLYREEAGFFPLVGDKADASTFLTHIGEKELEVPVGLGGGPRYMDANLDPTNRSRSASWESGTGRVTSLGNQARRIGESGRPAYGIYTAGSGTNTDFNIMGANAILQQLGQSKLTKKAEKAFDQAMREGTKAFPPIPDWPGIRSPKAEDMLLDKSQGILRTKLFDTMGKEDFQSMGFPDVPATRKAIMDPQLLDVPTNEAGFRIAKMDPTGRIIEDPLHPSDYPTAMAGELAGQLDMGVDYKDVFSTHFANRRLLSQPESGDYYSFSRAHPIQYADQEWLDKIKKAQEAKEKLIKTGSYAKGGDVKPKGGLAAATKSCSCHD
jgi:hypothetical protein